MQEFSFQTSVNGRYLLQPPSGSLPAPLLVGFHGYGQRAEDELALLCSIPGSGQWLCCAVEALHSFYIQRGSVGASWMTSRHRELRIEENLRYVNGVIASIRERYPVNNQIVFHGFSQGVAMACRAALLGSYTASALMLLGGDIPPGLDFSGSLLSVHLARGNRDSIYGIEKYEGDMATLRAAGVPVSATLFSGAHEAAEEYLVAAGNFLSPQ
jgi:predicted esterase